MLKFKFISKFLSRIDGKKTERNRKGEKKRERERERDRERKREGERERESAIGSQRRGERT